jgi:hypothetical protein
VQVSGTFRNAIREKTISAIGMLTVLFASSQSFAWVNITSPGNDATVSGTVYVRASVKQDYWSMLYIDGKAIESRSVGNVAFSWNTTNVGDGAHWVVVKGFQSGKTVADSSDKVAVSVLNHRSSDLSMHFYTRPASWPLPSGYFCSQVIPWESEPVSSNSTYNNTKPTSSELQAYAANGYAANPYDGRWAYARANGQYAGTTDMIMRWAACKWGIDEDVVRAQAHSETWSWKQTSTGDRRTTYSHCVNDNFKSLWNYQCSTCCYQSWSIFQTKVYYNWQTWPMMHWSTPFAADYRFADQRACMNGDLAGYFAGRPSYNGHTYAGDIAGGNLNTILWGCVGFHYSGNWYDGSSTSGAIRYINYVKDEYWKKPWKTQWPNVNWPD